MKKTEKYVLFWNGPFSQWYPSRFDIGGTEYNCCEQYMMAQKALMFGDTESYRMIMSTGSPKDQKEIGRRVKDFDKTKWESFCRQIVYDANYAKFTQNKALMEELVKTGSLEIAEASPVDLIWGIGLHETDPDALDKSKWQGTNWLGEAIMQVRDSINFID
jgi:ribA/ribD-fused uncharacterized protein